MPRKLFLSYASQDGEAARRICDALRAMSVEVWFDQSALRGGDAWDASIRREIRECALFVPIISANTQAREEGYFRREWNLAVNRTLDMADGKAFLLPVVIDATVDVSARVPEKFRDVQWTICPAVDRRIRSPSTCTRCCPAPLHRDVIGRQCANAITGRGCSPRARARVDCGAAIRQSQQGRGRRVLFRRPRRRAPERAREDPRPARGGAHVVVRL